MTRCVDDFNFQGKPVSMLIKMGPDEEHFFFSEIKNEPFGYEIPPIAE